MLAGEPPMRLTQNSDRVMIPGDMCTTPEITRETKLGSSNRSQNIVKENPGKNLNQENWSNLSPLGERATMLLLNHSGVQNYKGPSLYSLSLAPCMGGSPGDVNENPVT